MRFVAPLLLFIALLVAGCPRHDAADNASPGGPGAAGEVAEQPAAESGPALDSLPQVALIFSGTPGDAWGREIVQTAAGDLGFEAWSAAAAAEGIDTYGPYRVELKGQEAALSIAFSGLLAVATLEEQQALAQRCKAWLDQIEPDVVWLDGDIAQFQVGSLIELDVPIVFSGVVLDADIFYTEHRPYTGVYRRHGLAAVLGEVWAQNPEANHYALVSDDAPMSAATVRRFVEVQSLIGEGHRFTVEPTVHSWSELRQTLRKVGGDVDAVIICGMGNEGSSTELAEKACPANLLDGVSLPVVTLGPTRMDSAGALTVSIKPAAHAREALDLVGQLLRGANVADLPVRTPDDMAQFRTESGK